jgi:3-phosphoshikimate 1-carboxyvinyltransferase
MNPHSADQRYLVHPASRVHGELRVPGDKSISHRALMLGGIADGITQVEGFLASEDCLATLGALQAMGVRIERSADTTVRVHGAGREGLKAAAAALDLGNAGTAIRLFMGLLAGQRFDSSLVGDSSLMRRPMERVATPLRSMGARIDTADGKPPVRIHGGAALRAIDYVMPMASAQVKSAVLLAALYAQGVSTLIEPAPTRDHTERMLRAFGVQLTQQARKIAIAGGQRLRGCEIDVPGDFSSAAFFIVAGCLGASDGLTLRGVGVNPTRTGLLQMLRMMGADIEVRESTQIAGAEPIADLHIRKSALRGIRVPEALVPLAIDEFPIFFVAAAAASGETLVTGAAELRVKESDRLAVMATGLTSLGVNCELLPDGIRIVGGAPLRGGYIDSDGDHRIAMSFAVASLLATQPLEIGDVANVATSFPGFAGLARAAGLALED